MTPDTALILERGRDAKVLMDHPAFTAAINDLSTFYLSQMVSCPVDEAALPALREAHLMHTAIGALVSQLHGYVAVAEQAAAALIETDEEDL